MNPSIAYLQVPWGSGGRVELVRSTIGSHGNPHTSLDIVTAPGPPERSKVYQLSGSNAMYSPLRVSASPAPGFKSALGTYRNLTFGLSTLEG